MLNKYDPKRWSQYELLILNIIKYFSKRLRLSVDVRNVYF